MNNWKAIRLQILQRDNYTCYYCGAVGCPLDVHHKFPREFGGGGEDTEDNLIAVCDKCHPVAQSWTVDDSMHSTSTSHYTKIIKISAHTHSKLSKLGIRVGDTYDDVISRLTDEHNKIKRHIAKLDHEELAAYESGKETMADIVGKLVNEHNSGKERFRPRTT